MNINDDDGMGIDAMRFECALENELDDYMELSKTHSVHEMVQVWHDRQQEEESNSE